MAAIALRHFRAHLSDEGVRNSFIYSGSEAAQFPCDIAGSFKLCVAKLPVAPASQGSMRASAAVNTLLATTTDGSLVEQLAAAPAMPGGSSW